MNDQQITFEELKRQQHSRENDFRLKRLWMVTGQNNWLLKLFSRQQVGEVALKPILVILLFTMSDKTKYAFRPKDVLALGIF